MLLNDLQKDIKHTLIEENISVNDIAEKMNCSKANVYKLMSNKELTHSIVRVMDELGYDVKLSYIKREQ